MSAASLRRFVPETPETPLMKLVTKIFGLLLAGLALSSCGGGGGDSHGAFTPPQSGSITLQATATSLPLNTQGYVPHDHGPNQAEVTITFRHADGTLVAGSNISVTISPVNVAALSFLVQTGNTDIDQLWGTFTITGSSGVATAWVNAGTQAGTAVLTASAVDPNTNATVSASMTFTVTSGVGPAPASVSLVPTPAGVYLPSSGGNNVSQIAATVLDGGGQFVADPVSGNSGVDNIQYEIVGSAGDAILSTNSVSGPVSGTSVTSHTVHGVATASFQAGDSTPQGPIQVRATVDRADNNVTNGIQDPVSSTVSVIVSDGKLYSLEVTSPIIAPGLPGLTINSVSGDVSNDSSQIPPDPDATLSLTVSALATDRQGNPVLPGTPIRFGAVDEPVGAPGSAEDNQFLISGMDGNPQEGGTGFSAPTGEFTTAGGGAGPGDALLVFGKVVQGNADLESAATVAQVNGPTSLTTATAFNRNDTTGQMVDSGPVLPYLIGRAQHGNITASATTNDLGVAHAALTYTVNSVGDAVAIWAQGDGTDTVTGGARRVTDAGTLVYPGVAPATLAVSPLSITGDGTAVNVTACLTDAIGIPLRGVSIGFMYNLSAGGSGSVDGTNGTGTFDSLTGTNGCAVGVAAVTVPGSSDGGGDAGTLTISAAGQSVDITIAAPVVNTLTIIVDATAAASTGTYTVSINSGGFSPPSGGAVCSTAQLSTNTCTYQMVQGATATLTAAGPSGSQFTGWSGSCSGSAATVTVPIAGDTSCTATFGDAAP